MRLRPLSDVFSTVALAQEEGAGVGRAGGCRVTLGFLGWVFTLEGLGCSTLGQKKKHTQNAWRWLIDALQQAGRRTRGAQMFLRGGCDAQV